MKDYLELNVFFFNIACIYPLHSGASVWKRVMYYSWRFVVLESLIYIWGAAIFDLLMLDQIVFLDNAISIVNNGIIAGSLVRYLFYYAQGSRLLALMNDIRSIVRQQSDTGLQPERTIDSDYNQLSMFLRLYCVFCGTIGIVAAALPLFYLERDGRKLAVTVSYPYDWSKDFYYEITMFCQILANFYMAMGYFIADTFFVACVFLSKSQFTILAWEFENLINSALIKQGINHETVGKFALNFNNFERGAADQKKEYDKLVDLIKSSKEFENHLLERFKTLIQRHQRLLQLCESYQRFFSTILMFKILFEVFYMCLTAFSIIVGGYATLSELFSILQYAISGALECLMILYSGQIFTNGVEQVKEAMYRCPWYLCMNRLGTTFKFTQLSASGTVRLRAMYYFIIGADLYITMVKTAGSYIAVLRQVTENKDE